MHTHDLFFLTATVVGWKPLLLESSHKTIIANSLSFLSKEGRVKIYGFVIMPNHIHLIWKINPAYQRSDVQRDFLRFTSQQILKNIRNTNSSLYDRLAVGKKDRTRQFWQRNSRNIPLYSREVIEQKLDYIHHNPVSGRWRLVDDFVEYAYSSAGFYEINDTKSHSFLTHYMEYWGN